MMARMMIHTQLSLNRLHKQLFIRCLLKFWWFKSGIALSVIILCQNSLFVRDFGRKITRAQRSEEKAPPKSKKEIARFPPATKSRLRTPIKETKKTEKNTRIPSARHALPRIGIALPVTFCRHQKFESEAN